MYTDSSTLISIVGEVGFITNCYDTGDITGGKSACGIVASATNVDNCIALNGKVSAVPESGDASAKGYTVRICGLLLASGTAKNNYAATSIVVKMNDRTNVTVTDFSDAKLHGFDLTAQPLDLLNAYVSANPTFNNISLSKWKVTPGVNNGYPVFQ